MKFLKKIITKPKTFQRFFCLNLCQLNMLVENLTPLWEKSENKRKNTVKRKRKIGGGRAYKILSLEHKVIIVLMYYKLYLTQEFIGLIFDIDQSNVSRLLTKMLPLIEQAADPELATYLDKAKQEYEKRNSMNKHGNWIEFLQEYPDLSCIATDATEQRCFRSKDNKQQEEYYSGKKKQHTLKTQISVSKSGKVLDASKTFPGSVHDKKIIDCEETIKKIPKKTYHLLDLGYKGVVTQHPDSYIVLPHKKPKGGKLTLLQRELNTMISRRRVVCENAFSRIKKFKVCASLYRGPLKTYNQIFRNIIAIVNFRLTNIAI